ncbi:MAG: Gfo/Idh/MocA family oxidoreductase [Clostridia bacterium]|nr:Gfo/Idh/MocA family oxidoreductase [Clostridia bacterium]
MTKNEIFSFERTPSLGLEKGAYRFAVAGAAHGHIHTMCQGLVAEGAELVAIWEPDVPTRDALARKYPEAVICEDIEEIYARDDIRLVASAAIPVERASIGIRAMESGKDYFVDKAPMISLEQLDAVKETCARTGRKYFIYYCELVHHEGALAAAELISRGLIGKVAQVQGFGPHRLAAPTRPEWFFKRECTGGIIVDIGSQQPPQMLLYAGAKNGVVKHARVGNFFCPEYPDFDDYGDVMMTCDNGVPCYFRVDWMSPKGLSTWGDARTVIVGEKGFIEVRKNCDLMRDNRPNTVYLVTDDGEYTENVSGMLGFPFFRRLIEDSFNRTDSAMDSEFAFNAAEIAIRAQMMALGQA